MNDISRFRLLALRAMYLLIVVGLTLSTWSEVVNAVGQEANTDTVISAFLIGLVILSLLGLIHPLKMIPILLFEVVWKSAWLLLYALPLWLTGGLDEYGVSTAFACLLGVVLTPAVIPWDYVAQQYLGFQSNNKVQGY